MSKLSFLRKEFLIPGKPLVKISIRWEEPKVVEMNRKIRETPATD